MAGHKPKRILVVDDDSDVLEAIQAMLLHDGYDVHPASGGEQAVSKYKKIMPDIVFLDVMMPDVDGYKTFEKIVEIDSSARVVFTSSYMLDRGMYNRAKAMSLAGIVDKPVSIAGLRRMIRLHAR